MQRERAKTGTLASCKNDGEHTVHANTLLTLAPSVPLLTLISPVVVLLLILDPSWRIAMRKAPMYMNIHQDCTFASDFADMDVSSCLYKRYGCVQTPCGVWQTLQADSGREAGADGGDHTLVFTRNYRVTTGCAYAALWHRCCTPRARKMLLYTPVPPPT
jgi:hypothetical protein